MRKYNGGKSFQNDRTVLTETNDSVEGLSIRTVIRPAPHETPISSLCTRSDNISQRSTIQEKNFTLSTAKNRVYPKD